MDGDAARKAFAAAEAVKEPAFGNFFLSRFFGLDISYPDEARCVVETEVQDYMLNPQGVLHGGVTAFLLDVSMGHLVNRAGGGPGVTLEMKTQYLRAVQAGPVRCEAAFLKPGRRLAFLESRMTGPDGRLAAMATATFTMAGFSQGT